MAGPKLGYDDFIAAVDADCMPLVAELHRTLTDSGCKLEVKEAKSGYVVSYLCAGKTLLNYVFRKKGMLARIYANHLPQYMALMETLPQAMKKGIAAAPDCKRLLNPEACNPRCATGYDFLMEGQRHQKCRYSAFQFLLCEENNPFIRNFVGRELAASV